MKLVLLLILLSSKLIGYTEKESFSVYIGRATREHFLNIMQGKTGNFEDHYIFAFMYSREIAFYKNILSLGLEVHIADHFENLKFVEAGGAVVLRWKYFPWDRIVNTSIAFGSGFSYAFVVSDFEKKYEEDYSNLLKYLCMEFDFGLPKYSRIKLLARVHHRSGFLGIFNGLWGGPDYIGGGIRVLF